MLLAVSVGIILTVIVGAECTGSVGFTAAISTERTIAINTRVKYDLVYTNDGNGYNATTGVFTAPKGGLHNFQISALVYTSNVILLDLYHNEDYRISIYGNVPNSAVSAANSINLRLKRGDRVYVTARTPSYLLARTQEFYATFSGFFISP